MVLFTVLVLSIHLCVHGIQVYILSNLSGGFYSVSALNTSVCAWNTSIQLGNLSGVFYNVSALHTSVCAWNTNI